MGLTVTPAKAGVQGDKERLALDSRLRENDDVSCMERCGERGEFRDHVCSSALGSDRRSVPTASAPLVSSGNARV
jgi:hypothetical protein